MTIIQHPWFLFLSLSSLAFADSALDIFKRADACTVAFGAGWSSDTCKPSSTLCCIQSGSAYPQCRTGLGSGWCCVSDTSCYVDQPSMCASAGAVLCPVAAGSASACCGQGTTCAANFNHTLTNVRCNIAASLLSSSATTSSTSTSSALSTSSSTSTITSSSAPSSAIVTPSSTPNNTSSGSAALSTGAVAGIVLGPTLAILVVGIGLWYSLVHRQPANTPVTYQNEAPKYMPHGMAYSELPQSTQHFELAESKPTPVEMGSYR